MDLIKDGYHWRRSFERIERADSLTYERSRSENFSVTKHSHQQMFSITQVEKDAGSFANYLYEIYYGDKLVARYWHDFRGDGHGIKFMDGSFVHEPVGSMSDFIKGGGPEPLILSGAAVAFLQQRFSGDA